VACIRRRQLIAALVSASEFPGLSTEILVYKRELSKIVKGRQLKLIPN
jgi:hypothetical protein